MGAHDGPDASVLLSILVMRRGLCPRVGMDDMR
jgi:hypothetical protein